MHVKVMSGFGIIRTSKAQNGNGQMIKRIQIKNFKCYGEPGVDFSLKRINFIFGDNSAGKSTFLQLIRMVLNGEEQKIDENFKDNQESIYIDNFITITPYMFNAEINKSSNDIYHNNFTEYPNIFINQKYSVELKDAKKFNEV